MLFNSIEFLVFFPIVYILYWFVNNKNLSVQNSLIIIASYFFYGFWDWKFLLLLVLSTLIDYGFGLLIYKSSRKKIILWLSVINNLLILAVFKYYNFFATELCDSMRLLGWNVYPYIIHVALPVGISFYTFHGMSYVFDIYRGRTTPQTNFINYAVFVSFFPLLVAGPIERAAHLIPQIIKPRKFSYSQSVSGLKLILWGLFKKVVIADHLAPDVNVIFSNYENFNGSTLALGAVYFAFQIYCDFSGYSDIAIGTARLLGFELFSNFKFPYFSRNIGEFWKRWHMSLTSWFRDYVYIPLGGSKEGKAKSIRNIFIIFLLSGFWHGANWTYIIWGLIHAALYIPLLFIRKKVLSASTEVVAQGRLLPNLRETFQMLGTFAAVCIAWVFFRSEDLSHAILYLKKMTFEFFRLPLYKSTLLFVIPVIILDWVNRNNERFVFQRVNIVPFAVITIFLIILFKPVNTKTEFIYFQF